MNDLRKWLLDKIVANLVARQGCTIVGSQDQDLDKVIISDSMGFMYEINVSCVGRLKNNAEDDVQWQTQETRKAQGYATQKN